MSALTPDSIAIFNAFKFAIDSHRYQKRGPNDEAYVGHPAAVADILREAGTTRVDVLVGALLHDVVEDCGVTLEEIEEKFGKDVRDMVEDCSDDKSKPKEVRKQLQITHVADLRKRAIEGDLNALGALLIKWADKIHNMEGLSEMLKNVNEPHTKKTSSKEWREVEIIGCWRWSIIASEAGLCEKCKGQGCSQCKQHGIHNDYLMARLKKICDKFPLKETKEEAQKKLMEYYGDIQNSD